LSAQDKRDLLSDLDASFKRLMAAARAHPEIAPSAGRAGDWGAFEALAHIAGWHLSAAARLRQIASGEAVTPPGTADQMNERFVRERAGLSREQLFLEVEGTFAEMRSAGAGLAPSHFRRAASTEEHSLAYFILWANGPGHYAEHIEQLERSPPA